jgi:hypothetical protein
MSKLGKYVKIKRMKELEINIKGIFDRTVNSLSVYGEMATAAIRLIKGFTRSGKEASGGKYRSIKSLAESTINQRRRMARYNKTSELFSPEKSNLTFTGQLIESVKTLAIKVTQRMVVVGPEGKRKPYKNKDGSNVGSSPKRKGQKNAGPPTNEELGRYVAEQGRLFLFLDDKGKKQLKNIVLKHLRRQLKSR